MKSLDTVTFLDFLLILTLHVVIELILKPLVDELELLLQIHGFIMRLSRPARVGATIRHWLRSQRGM